MPGIDRFSLKKGIVDFVFHSNLDYAQVEIYNVYILPRAIQESEWIFIQDMGTKFAYSP